MIDKILLQLNNNISGTLVCIIVILAVGYSFSGISHRLTYSFTIGHNRDTEAAFFSNLSIISYVVAILMTVVILTGTVTPQYHRLREVSDYNTILLCREDDIWGTTYVDAGDREGVFDMLPNAVDRATREFTKSTHNLIKSELLEY